LADPALSGIGRWSAASRTAGALWRASRGFFFNCGAFWSGATCDGSASSTRTISFATTRVLGGGEMTPGTSRRPEPDVKAEEQSAWASADAASATAKRLEEALAFHVIAGMSGQRQRRR
jgi:hypothetical protein